MFTVKLLYFLTMILKCHIHQTGYCFFFDNLEGTVMIHKTSCY